MAYFTNPNLPKVMAEAVRLHLKGWTQEKVANHFGYTQGAVSKWATANSKFCAICLSFPSYLSRSATESTGFEYHPQEIVGKSRQTARNTNSHVLFTAFLPYNTCEESTYTLLPDNFLSIFNKRSADLSPNAPKIVKINLLN